MTAIWIACSAAACFAQLISRIAAGNSINIPHLNTIRWRSFQWLPRITMVTDSWTFTAAPIVRPRQPERVPQAVWRKSRKASSIGPTNSFRPRRRKNTAAALPNTANSTAALCWTRLGPPTSCCSIAAMASLKSRPKTAPSGSGAIPCRPPGATTTRTATPICSSRTTGRRVSFSAMTAPPGSRTSPRKPVRRIMAFRWARPLAITTTTASKTFTSLICIAPPAFA